MLIRDATSGLLDSSLMDTGNHGQSKSAYVTPELKRHNNVCISIVEVFIKIVLWENTNIFYSLHLISSKV